MLLFIEAITHGTYSVINPYTLKIRKLFEALSNHLPRKNYSYDYLQKLKAWLVISTTPLSEVSTSQLLGWPLLKRKKLRPYKLNST